MANYLLVDQNSIVQNIVVWDGVTPVIFPEGETPVEYDGPAWTGGYWNGVYVTDPNPQPVPELTVPSGQEPVVL